MKTMMAKAEEVKRNWYVVDASGMVLGRLATQVASILRGKNKPCFTPNVDTGDFVIVLNCDKIILTGKKAESKVYRHHTGYVGGLKEKSFKEVMKTKPVFAVQHAVKGMLPKNTLGRAMYGKLFTYEGGEHPHQAQQPAELKLK